MDNFMINLHNYLQTGGKKNEKLKDMYCGADKLPKGKKFGSIYDCHKKGQIRLWGRLDLLKLMLKEKTKEANDIRKKINATPSYNLKESFEKVYDKVMKKINKIKKEIKETEEALKKNGMN
jgi:hypothetical protein